MKKLPEGWLYVPVSPETWTLISVCGDQEKTADEIINWAFHSIQSERDKVLDNAIELWKRENRDALWESWEIIEMLEKLRYKVVSEV